MQVEFLADEYWWGGNVHDGVNMPYDSSCNVTVDLSLNTSNQSSGLFVSSKGRYFYDDEPYTISFKYGSIITDREISFSEGHCNLKGAYLAAMKKYFPFNGTSPNELFFAKPQYNTWIALNHNQTENGILYYVNAILGLGLPPGILMIDSCWERFFGDLDFDRGRFPNPKEMIDKLHKLGFKVMLWISPCISPDTTVFRSLRNTDIIIRDKDNNPAIRKWWDGYSAVLDLTNPKACEWFSDKLNYLRQAYGIDGFKLDGGDTYFYKADDLTFVKGSPQSQIKAFAQFAQQFEFNELRMAWNNGGSPLVMRLADKQHSWDGYGLNMLIPNTFVQGLTGYSYCCPDMIGGGEYMQFNSRADSLDAELFVRYAQTCALMPMMQYSALPSCLKDEKAVSLIVEAAHIRENYSDYIIETVKQCAKSGEPIMRPLAYSFPDGEFEQTKDMFMLGDSLLVAPVTKKGVTEITVVLPDGEWKYVPTGEIYNGGICTVPAGIEILPHFEKIL